MSAEIRLFCLRMVACSFMALSAAVALAQTEVRLNPTLEEGEVAIGEFSPNGAFVLLRAPLEGAEPNDVDELFVYSRPDGTLTKVNGSLPDGQTLGTTVTPIAGGFAPEPFSSDSNYIVYIAPQDLPESELFSYEIGTDTRTKLNSSLPAFNAVESFTILPDTDRVIYPITDEADIPTRNVIQRTVRLDGTGGAEITYGGVASNNQNVTITTLLPAASGDTFLSLVTFGPSVNNRQSVPFAAPLQGGAAVPLIPAELEAGISGVTIAGGVQDRYLFLADLTASEPGNRGLYVTTAPGYGLVRVDDPAITAAAGIANAWLSPDGQTVLYRLQSNGAFYAVPAAGGTNQAATFPPATTLTGTAAASAFLGEGTQLLVYLSDEAFVLSVDADSLTGATFDLTTVPQNNSLAFFTAVPDDSKALLRFDQPSGTEGLLYGIDTEAATITRLDSTIPIATNLAMIDAFFMRDGFDQAFPLAGSPLSVAYVGISDAGNQTWDLIQAPFEGGTPEVLNTNSTEGGQVMQVITAQGGEIVGFNSDHDGQTGFDFFVLSLDEAAPELAGEVERIGPQVTNSTTVSWRITFDEAVTLTVNDITVNGLAGDVSISGGPSSYVVSVALSDPAPQGAVSIDIAAGIPDLSGNVTPAGFSAPQFTIDPDINTQPFPEADSGTPVAGGVALLILAAGLSAMGTGRIARR